MYKIGVTASRYGLTHPQRAAVRMLLSAAVDLRGIGQHVLQLHHGKCVGGDEEMLIIAKDLGIWTVAHPSIFSKWTSLVESDDTREALPPLERNHNIVDECNEIFACPNTVHEVLRSGTWATIRYARRAGKSLTISPP